MELSNQLQAYLRLRHASDAGVPSLGRALKKHGTLAALLAAEADNAALQEAVSGSERRQQRKVEQELEWQQQKDHTLLLFESNDYPPLLREIDDPPPLLAVRGNPLLLKKAQIAGVGSRKCSQYGSNIARWLAQDLASCGLILTSGLARGIDEAIHLGALDRGATIAVTATGQDRIYPNCHKGLAERIMANGAIVSEFPLGMPPYRGNFPRRNRIISGLSSGVLVVEAGLKSGSLITARLASEQNREVFAVPGNINLGHARGCHWLLRCGAKLVECAGDVLQELPDELLASLRTQRPTCPESGNSESTGAVRDPACRAVLATLNGETMLMDDLLQRSGLGIDLLHASLLQLEIQGIIRTRAGRVSPVNSGL